MHTDQDDAINELLEKTDILDPAQVQTFCQTCYMSLTQTNWKVFQFSDFISKLPDTDTYLESGDYVGAATKYAFSLYDKFNGGSKLDNDKKILSSENSISNLLRSTHLFDNESPEWIMGALALAVGKAISHVGTCDGHDISNPTSFFNELRFPIASSVFRMDEQYQEVCGKIGMLIMGATASKSPPEKNGALTYYLDYILRVWDELPIPANQSGCEVIDAMGEIRLKRNENYGLFVSKLFAATMAAIQLGLIDLDHAKVLTSIIGEYVSALEQTT